MDLSICGLHRMHEILTILTDVHSVCVLICLPRCLNQQSTPRAVCVGSFGAAFAECLWPLVFNTVIDR